MRSRFTPKPGQVDYTRVRFAPVINCVLKYRGKILLVQRSRDLHFYPGYWNGVSGFLDDKRSLEQKVKDELREEIGAHPRDIKSIRLGKIFHQEAPRYGKTWIVHPVLVEVRTNKVRLDWEASGYRWLTLGQARKLKLLPGFGHVLGAVSLWLGKRRKGRIPPSLKLPPTPWLWRTSRRAGKTTSVKS